MPEEECPFCGGRTESAAEDLLIRGINYGEYEVTRCLECGETIYEAEVWDLIREVLATPLPREVPQEPSIWSILSHRFSWPTPDGSATASPEFMASQRAQDPPTPPTTI